MAAMNLHDLSDNEVLRRSRSLRDGVEAERLAIEECKRRGIYSAKEHMASMPMAMAFRAGKIVKPLSF